MKVLLVVGIAVAMVTYISAVIDLQVNTKKKEQALAFVARVRNYMTHDNMINSNYIREVLKECFLTSDDVTNDIVEKCSTEQETPGKTADYLYECIVNATDNAHIDDNRRIDKESGLCQLKLINFIEDGEINEDVVKRKMILEGEDEKTADKVVKKCSANEGTPEATADNFINCLAEEYNLKE